MVNTRAGAKAPAVCAHVRLGRKFESLLFEIPWSVINLHNFHIRLTFQAWYMFHACSSESAVFDYVCNFSQTVPRATYKQTSQTIGSIPVCMLKLTSRVSELLKSPKDIFPCYSGRNKSGMS